MSDLPVSPALSAVRFEKVTCQIGKRTVLDGIDLDLKQGDITGILGPNGAGKTTLLSAIMGLRAPSSGKITVLGESLPFGAALRQRIGVVFQETALYDELTTYENLRFAASLYSVPNPRKRIEETLTLLGLAERSRERVGHLSGGLRRRVTIARAFLHAPDLLLIDEPTLGVDVEARHTIWAHLRLLRANGATIIVSTNYLDEAIALCDTVTVLREGKALISETPQALVARAGCCLDIECAEATEHAVRQAIGDAEGILRIAPTSTGLAVFLRGDSVPEAVMGRVLQATAIRGFRIRGADLAEIFQALEAMAT